MREPLLDENALIATDAAGHNVTVCMIESSQLKIYKLVIRSPFLKPPLESSQISTCIRTRKPLELE